jgi:hypothetical protein
MSTYTVGGTLLMLFGLSACVSFGGDPGRARLSGDFSYYEPFDNSSETGPNYLIGPPVPGNAKLGDLPDSNTARSFPTIPDKTLPPSCLTCD